MILVLAAWGAPVLDDPAFRFCHEYADFRYNDAFCNLISEVDPERCPGLHEYCRNPDDAPAAGCAQDGVGSGPLSRTPNGEEPEEPDRPWNPFGLDRDASGAAGALVTWVVALLVAMLLMGIAAMVLRFVGLRRPAPMAPRSLRTIEPHEEQSFAEAVDDVPDLPSADLLHRARSALGEGDPGAAVVLARGAVLRELGERRVLKLHRSRTDLEYLDQAGPELRADLAGVLGAAERHKWGRLPIDPGTAGDALTAAERVLG